MSDYDKEIEEAFYKWAEKIKSLRNGADFYESFIAGAKWQQQKDAENGKNLKFLRYCAHAYVLHWYENKYKSNREDILEITPSGGHGYIHCTVTFKKGSHFISEECEAGMLLDYWELKKQARDR